MILSKSLLEQEWPMMHGFFIIMGGFHPFEHGFMGAGYYNKAILHDHNVPLHPLATCNLFEDDCQVREFYGGNSGNSGRQVRTYEMSEGTSASAYVLRPFQTLVPRFRNGEIGDRRSKDRSKNRSWSRSRNLEDELSRWELIRYSNWTIYMTCPKYLC